MPAGGTVYWDGPDARGLAAAALGDRPFTYEVELVLDGLHYVATAEWPADVIAGNEPSVALEFDPDLPPPSRNGRGSLDLDHRTQEAVRVTPT